MLQQPLPLTRVDEPLPYATMGEYVDEQFLTEEIDNLWAGRESYTRVIKSQKLEIRSMESTLAEMLFTMKAVLSKPGRRGGWSSWLKNRKIPRATADRLVNRYTEEKGLTKESPHEANRFLPPDAEVSRLAIAIWPRIQKALHSPQSYFMFLCWLAEKSGLEVHSSSEGTMVYDPSRCHEPAATHVPVVANPAEAEDDDSVF